MFTIFDENLDRLAREVHDNNRSYFSGQWRREDLENYQLERLKNTIRYVKSNSKFYSEHLSGVGDEDIQGLTPETLRNIPFTEKAHLRDGMFDVLSKPVSQAWVFYETTGTTGPSTPCPRDNTDSIYSNTALTLSYETILKKENKKHVVGVSGPTELHSFGDTFGDVCRNLMLPVVKMWPHSPVVGYEKALEVIRRLGITVLMCTPGMAFSLAKAAKRAGQDPAEDFALEILMLTGELSSEALLKNIETVWGAKAFNFLYASQEASVLSAAVDTGEMHTFPLNNYYEVIDPATSEPVDPREGVLEGELVVTMLFQGAKPLVRYRTGDLVRLRPAGQNSLFPSPTLEVLGRTHDSIDLNGHWVAAYDLEGALMSRLRGCLDYQITIDREDGVDTLLIELEMANDADGTHVLRQEISQEFLDRFRTPTSVEFGVLGTLGTTGAMVSWKAARILDKRLGGVDPERRAALNIAQGRRAS